MIPIVHRLSPLFAHSTALISPIQNSVLTEYRPHVTLYGLLNRVWYDITASLASCGVVCRQYILLHILHALVWIQNVCPAKAVGRTLSCALD